MTITAKVIQHSISFAGMQIITFELEYPRFIHAELMTHRVFSRNAASSRAIPVPTMLANIASNPAAPTHWGANQPGMQADSEVDDVDTAKTIWAEAALSAVDFATEMHIKGVHKQVVNRITEPFQNIKTVVTSTEWANWFALRNHKDAQPEIRELARLMLEAMNYSVPMVLVLGDWHVPYVDRVMVYSEVLNRNVLIYIDGEGDNLTTEEAKIISASCCAQVSYRKSDDSLEKAKVVYDRLVGSEPKHSSPFEHQAVCPKQDHLPTYGEWEPGFTHADRNGYLWSNNFKGWIQNRALL